MKIAVLLSALVLSLSCGDALSDLADGKAPYAVGDTGPAGGIIFYVNDNYASDHWRYMEASPTDETSVRWARDNVVVGVSSATVGSGKPNSAAMHANDVNATSAVNACLSKIYSGYDDWFLPSLDELMLMHANLYSAGLGTFVAGDYWCSTEYSDSQAWIINFSSGTSGQSDKNSQRLVRAIRQF